MWRDSIFIHVSDITISSPLTALLRTPLCIHLLLLQVVAHCCFTLFESYCQHEDSRISPQETSHSG